jgi:hypothetical protein
LVKIKHQVDAPTVAAIYDRYRRSKRDDRRPHLGASLLGHPCDRFLWLTLRWAAQEEVAGRVMRLFRTGELEEARLVKDLRDIGVTVMDRDPDTGRQWKFMAEGGHVGGSADAMAIGFPDDPDKEHVVEFKTHNVKSFEALLKKGVKDSKIEHWTQIQVYLLLSGVDRSAYLAVCKNDDRLYMERVHLDEGEAKRIVRRANRIAADPWLPLRIHDDPAKPPCSWCRFKGLCHEGGWAERNCRTCLHVVPEDGGAWRCNHPRHRLGLTLNVQKEGCADQRYVPDLVPGEQVDAAEDASWVEYRMPDGSVWRDKGEDDGEQSQG